MLTANLSKLDKKVVEFRLFQSELGSSLCRLDKATASHNQFNRKKQKKKQLKRSQKYFFCQKTK